MDNNVYTCGTYSWFRSSNLHFPPSVTITDNGGHVFNGTNSSTSTTTTTATFATFAGDAFQQNQEDQSFLESLQNFSRAYQPWHGYLCLVICTFGLLTNVLNFVVLTRPNMRTSINMILAAIALCDTGTMASYLIYVVRFYVATPTCPSDAYTYGWMNFILFHSLWSILLHSSSIWLVVLLAMMRLAVMKRAKFSHIFMKPENVWKLMLYIYAPLGALCMPVIFTHTVIQIDMPRCDMWSDFIAESSTDDAFLAPKNHSRHGIFDKISIAIEKPSTLIGYTVVPSKAALENNCALLRAVLWINGICFKLLPCLLLAFSIWGLLRTLDAARERNIRVLRRRSTQKGGTESAASGSTKYFNSRTTKMLLAILSIFLVTELPQALVATLSGWNPNDVYFKIYPSLGDVLDLLSLLNSGVNFLLYCAMSSRFRTTFLELFTPKTLRAAIRRRRRRFSVSENELANCTITNGQCGGAGVGNSLNNRYSISTNNIRTTTDNQFDRRSVSNITVNGRQLSLSVYGSLLRPPCLDMDMDLEQIENSNHFKKMNKSIHNHRSSSLSPFREQHSRRSCSPCVNTDINRKDLDRGVSGGDSLDNYYSSSPFDTRLETPEHSRLLRHGDISRVADTTRSLSFAGCSSTVSPGLNL